MLFVEFVLFCVTENKPFSNMASTNSSKLGREWDLSAYELQRTPHEVITDDTEIAVPLRSLERELMCPICLDLLNKTVATKCLHR